MCISGSLNFLSLYRLSDTFLECYIIYFAFFFCLLFFAFFFCLLFFAFYFFVYYFFAYCSLLIVFLFLSFALSVFFFWKTLIFHFPVFGLCTPKQSYSIKHRYTSQYEHGDFGFLKAIICL